MSAILCASALPPNFRAKFCTIVGQIGQQGRKSRIDKRRLALDAQFDVPPPARVIHAGQAEDAHAGEAPLAWPEIQALAMLHEVELLRNGQAIILRLPRAVVTTPLKMVPV